MSDGTTQQTPPATPQPTPSQTPPPAPAPGNKDERMWAMFCHLSAFVGYVIPVPFANIIGPLVIWLIKREEYPMVNDQGKEALNFQITIGIGLVAGLLLSFVCIGIPIVIALAIADLVFVIIAAIKANEGVLYRYPFAIRFVK
jgi:uncharacterized Tic20 family protein